MKSLIIRDLDDALLVQLKKRAWQQGLPLEESLRRLVIESVSRDGEPFDEGVTVPARGDLVQAARHYAAMFHS